MLYYTIARSLNNARLLSLVRQNVHDVIPHGFMILNTIAVMYHLLIFNTLIIGYDSIQPWRNFKMLKQHFQRVPSSKHYIGKSDGVGTSVFLKFFYTFFKNTIACFINLKLYNNFEFLK